LSVFKKLELVNQDLDRQNDFKDEQQDRNRELEEAAKNNLVFNCAAATQFMATQSQQSLLLETVQDMEDEEFGTLNSQMNIDTNLSAKEYVARMIKYAEELFRQDRGHRDTKRANLGDIRST